jgi:signal transduction histidine kinase/CheY-like chemotaxis protein
MITACSLHFLQRLSVLLVMSFVLASTPVLAQQPSTPTLTAEEQAWLAEHPEIRIGAAVIPPVYMLDNSGQPTGIAPDVFQRIEQLLGIRLTLVKEERQEMQRKARSRELDGMFAVVPELAEANNTLVTQPYLRQFITVFSRSQDQFELNSLDDLARKRVAYTGGFKTVENALEHLKGHAALLKVENFQQGMKLVLEGGADVYVGLGLEQYYLLSNNISGIKIAYVDTEQISGSISIRSDWPELVGIINKALNAIGELEINRLIAKWLYVDVSSATSLLTEQERQWLLDHPDITLAYHPGMEPLLIADSENNYSGALVDIYKELGQRLGVNFEIQLASMENMQEKLKARRLDGLLLAGQPLLGQAGLLTTDTIISTFTSAFVADDAPFLISRMKDLRGKRVAYVGSLKVLEAALDREQLQGQVELMPVATVLDGMQLVMNGKADVYLGFNFHDYIVKKYLLDNIKLVYTDASFELKGGTGIRSDWPELVSIINKGLGSFAPGEISSILNKWIRVDSSNKGLAITDSQREWLKTLGPLKLGIVGGLQPFEDQDDEGQMAGLHSEYLNIIRDKLQLDIELFVYKDFYQQLKAFKAGEIDLASGLTQKVAEQEQLLTSSPFFRSPIVIVARREASLITELPSLEGKTIAVLKGSNSQLNLQRNYPMIKLLEVMSPSEGLLAVVANELDGMMLNAAAAEYLQRKLDLRDLKIAYTSDYAIESVFTLKSELAPLLPLINRVLAEISSREKSLIFEKWINIRVEHQVDWATMMSWGAFFVLIAALIIGCVLYWNRRLSLEVAERKRAEEAAEQASKSKSVFLSNMSHELRTPLNAVLGFSEILRGQITDKGQLHYLNSIHTAGHSLLSLINDVLDLSKIEAGKLELNYSAVSLVNLLAEVDMLFQQQAQRKTIEFKIAVDEHVPAALLLDESRLRQILLNLVGNALKFTEQGYIHVSVSTESDSGSSQSRVTLVIAVEDTGIGVAGDQQETIFGAFDQARKQKLGQYGGTGLGLAISQQLAGMMNGGISLHSEVGKGSIFTLRLPDVEIAATDKISTDQQHELDYATLHFKPAKLLIADDVDYNRELLITILGGWDFEFVEAQDGQQTIDKAIAEQPDLILLDMKMPVMDGYEASEQLRTLPATRQIPVIAVTASALKQDEQLISNYCDAYLRKPVDKQALITTVMKFLPYQQSSNHRVIETEQCPGAAFKHARVLVAEDNAVNQMVIKGLLAKQGIEPVFACNGLEAVGKVQECLLNQDTEGGGFHLLLMDCEMPEMDGFEATEKIRSLESGVQDLSPLPIIALSAHSPEEIKQRVRDCGMDDLLSKPISSDQLERVLQLYVGH